MSPVSQKKTGVCLWGYHLSSAIGHRECRGHGGTTPDSWFETQFESALSRHSCSGSGTNGLQGRTNCEYSAGLITKMTRN